ncbi:MAG: ABC transporter ATP-binding protein [Chloroflexota bacterium]
MVTNTNTFPVWKATRELIKFRPKYLAINILGRGYFVLSRLFPGLLIQQIFNRLTDAAPATLNIMTLLVMILAIEFSRVLAFYWGGWGSALVRNSNQILLRRNIIQNTLDQPGALGIPMSPGEAINRLDGDVADFADFPTWLPELIGHLIFFVVAVGIMGRISWQITAVALIPFLFVGFLTQFSFQRLLHYATVSRDSDSAVTGFLGEVLAAVQAIKVADAHEDAIRYYESINDTRRHANVRMGTFWAVFASAANNAGDIAIALMILLVGQQLSNGSFTIGDFALFTSYLYFAARFPAEVGSYVSEWINQRVSIRRMHSIQPAADPAALFKHQPVYEQTDVPQMVHVEKTKADTLNSLEVRGLTYLYQTAQGADQSGVTAVGSRVDPTATGIKNINLTLPQGSFTVITGKIGSGKSTLLRVLLGLLPRDAGEILWNDGLVDDPAAFFVPPRSAYTPQVPRLFSDPLKDNILMGLPEAQYDWQAAVETAVLTPDIPTLEKGIETVVGPRGVRLSGGQVQRSAAARMFVRDAELLVFDDLSSALDVETERKLWANLGFEGQSSKSNKVPDPQSPIPNPQKTFLVVSHRPSVLQMADQIVVMENGRIAATGDYETLKSHTVFQGILGKSMAETK